MPGFKKVRDPKEDPWGIRDVPRKKTSFWDRLLGRRPDPTRDWGAFRPPLPDFHWDHMRLGNLGFGDPIEAAETLGRPDRFQWTRKDYGEMLYASGGFQMDFNGGRLAYLAFFLGPDACLPDIGSLEFSEPMIIGLEPQGLRLTNGMNRQELKSIMGPWDSVDQDPEETILVITRQGITMEFEIDGPSDRLKRWNLYPR